MFLIGDHVNGKEIALSRKVGMKFGFEYYLIHVSSPEYECWELICIMELHINLIILESYFPYVRKVSKY